MSESPDNNQDRIRHFFDLSEVWKYYFRKKDPNKKNNLNLRLMHGINKIALFMFLASLIYLIVKYVFIY
jgi:hypothetical protein